MQLQQSFHDYVDEQRNKRLLLPYLPELVEKEAPPGRVEDDVLEDAFRYPTHTMLNLSAT